LDPRKEKAESCYYRNECNYDKLMNLYKDNAVVEINLHFEPDEPWNVIVGTKRLDPKKLLESYIKPDSMPENAMLIQREPHGPEANWLSEVNKLTLSIQQDGHSFSHFEIENVRMNIEHYSQEYENVYVFIQTTNKVNCVSVRLLVFNNHKG